MTQWVLLIVSFILAGSSIPKAAHANGPEQAVVKLALYKLLESRCRHYGYGIISPIAGDCRMHANVLLDTLTVRSARLNVGNNTITVGAFYADELTALYTAPRTQRFLETIDHQLRNTSNSFNLWDQALAAANNDFRTAWAWLALIFQDTSEAKMPLRYLLATLPPSYFDSLVRLDRITDALNRLPAQALYPRALAGVHSKALYHFYTIGYMALRTIDQSNRVRFGYSEYLVRANPFIINTVYEYFRNKLVPGISYFPTKINEINLIEVAQTIQQWAHPTDPTNIDRTHHEDTLDDIYLGYAGVEFATRLGSAIPLDRETFIQRFAHDPKRTIQLLYF